MLTHANIVSSITCFVKTTSVKITEHDYYLSYLPLAHVMERSVIVGLTYFGVHVGIFNGNNLKLK